MAELLFIGVLTMMGILVALVRIGSKLERISRQLNAETNDMAD